MSRNAERLARAAATLKEIKAKNDLRVIIADATYGNPIVIDFKSAKPSKPSTRPAKTRRTKGRSSR